MSSMPMIQADLNLLRSNVAFLKEACMHQEVQLAAVTKVTCADPVIADALVEAGADMLADSRVKNLANLPHKLPRLSLRVADPEEAEALVAHSEYSLQSGLPALKVLGKAAKKLNKPHQVILMIDLGDLREGILFRNREQILDTARAVLKEEGLVLAGVGTNLTCFGGILPDAQNLGVLLEIAADLRRQLGIPLPLVSGGNSSSLHLLLSGKLPSGINHLRLGEGLMLGMDTSDGTPIQQLSQQVFTQFARLVEVYDKPSKPIGKAGPNAFGEEVFFEDLGPMRRGILAIGRQDTDAEGLTPLDTRVKVLGASSDHLIVDLNKAPDLKVGDVLGFTPGYGALLKAYTSAYIHKEYLR